LGEAALFRVCIAVGVQLQLQMGLLHGGGLLEGLTEFLKGFVVLGLLRRVAVAVGKQPGTRARRGRRGGAPGLRPVIWALGRAIRSWIGPQLGGDGCYQLVLEGLSDIAAGPVEPVALGVTEDLSPVQALEVSAAIQGDGFEPYRDDGLADADAAVGTQAQETGELLPGDESAGEEAGGEEQQAEIAAVEGLIDLPVPIGADGDHGIEPGIAIDPFHDGEPWLQEIQEPGRQGVVLKV